MILLTAADMGAQEDDSMVRDIKIRCGNNPFTKICVDPVKLSSCIEGAVFDKTS